MMCGLVNDFLRRTFENQSKSNFPVDAGLPSLRCGITMQPQTDDTILKKNTRDELGDGADDVRIAHFRGIHD